MSLIALGVMPYITASIVIQLAASLHPSLMALKKEGEAGRKKLNQYTRYGTVFLCAVQGWFLASGLEAYGAQSGLQAVVDPGMTFRIVAVVNLVGGTMFLLWLGRADHQPGDRQRRVADHHGRHRGAVPHLHRQPVRGRAHGLDQRHRDRWAGGDGGGADPGHLLLRARRSGGC